jgi:hypothetical protein
MRSPRDIWAIGRGDGVPIATHWDGQAWKRSPVDVTGIGPYDAWLSAAVGSPADAWAVGSFLDRSIDSRRPLIERFHDGSWRRVLRVPLPPLTSSAVLNAIGASPRWGGLWSVGTASHEGWHEVFVLRRIAGRWERIALPPRLREGAGHDVEMSERSVWIATDHRVLRWDGDRWSARHFEVPRGAQEWSMTGLAVAGDTAWAVGGAYGETGWQVLVQHWTGHRWEIVAVPALAEPEGWFAFVASAAPAVDVWFGGVAFDSDIRTAPVLWHWDGLGLTPSALPLETGGMSGLVADRDFAMVTIADDDHVTHAYGRWSC